MFGWFKRKSKLERLQSRYRELMHHSYEISLHDPIKSEKYHRQADKILEEIKYYSLDNEKQ